MVATKAIDIVIKSLAGGALVSIFLALLVVSVNLYNNNPGRCSDYAIQEAHVVNECLRLNACTVTPKDITNALRAESAFPQCFIRPKVEVPHDKETVQATRSP